MRILLLTLGVLAVVVVVVLLLAYNFGRTETPRASTGGEAVSADGTISLAEKVRFVHSSDGQPIFEVRADSERQDADGVSRLEVVRVEFYRADGETFVVTSDKATLDRRTLAALFEGHVQVTGWGDLELDARALEVAQGGEIVQSRGDVDFRWGTDIEGRTSSLRMERTAQRVLLRDGVHVRSRPGVTPSMRLDCQRLIYDRGARHVRAHDGVHLVRDAHVLRADVLNLFLQEDMRTLERAIARFGVEGRMASADTGGAAPSEARYVGDKLTIEPAATDAGLLFAKLEGTDTVAATMSVVTADGLGQRLEAQTIEARSQDGRPTQLQGKSTGRLPSVMLSEFLDTDPPHVLRQACGQEVTAGFDNRGEVSQVFLSGQVEIRDAQRHLTGGDQAVVTRADERIEISGPRVEIYDPRGDLVAPKVVVVGSRGVMEAEGGVEATLYDTDQPMLANTPLGQGDGPIRIASQRAVWTDRPSTFGFSGEVRAWQGPNLLLSDQLRGDQTRQELSASGGVTTLWTPQRGGLRRPVEIKADTMSFLEAQGRLLYDGSVRMHSDGRRLRCQEMTVFLGAGGQGAERMVCREDVFLQDPVAGRRIAGDRALYDVAQDLLEVFGDEVTVENTDGSRLQGAYMRYDMASGSTRLDTKAPDGRDPGPRPGSATRTPSPATAIPPTAADDEVPARPQATSGGAAATTFSGGSDGST